MNKSLKIRLMLLLVAGFIVYFFLYLSIDRPLTTGEIDRLYVQKVNLSKSPADKRIFIIAGSNGRFSHSCKVISQELNVFCGNLSIAAGIGVDFLIESYLPNLKAGDIVYMPMEFQQYELSREQVYSGPENSLLFKRYRELLYRLGWKRTIRAAFFADEQYFIDGIVETILNKRGFKRRFDENSINSFGDQRGHDEIASLPYKHFIDTQKQVIPDLAVSAPNAYSVLIIKDFLKRAKERGVLVIGGLPTTFADAPIPAGTLIFLKDIYESEGQRFLVLDNQSKYLRSCFFDIAYHLNESCQATHSKNIALALKDYL